jgi:hypothetical protein
MNRLKALLFCGALAAFVGLAQAQTMPEDPVIKMDEAAEAEARAAEAKAEAKAERLREEAEMEKEEVRGAPMPEAEVHGED